MDRDYRKQNWSKQEEVDGNKRSGKLKQIAMKACRSIFFLITYVIILLIFVGCKNVGSA